MVRVHYTHLYPNDECNRDDASVTTDQISADRTRLTSPKLALAVPNSSLE